MLLTHSLVLITYYDSDCDTTDMELMVDDNYKVIKLHKITRKDTDAKCSVG